MHKFQAYIIHVLATLSSFRMEGIEKRGIQREMDRFG